MKTFYDSQTINQTSHNDTATLVIDPTGANNSMTFTPTSAGSWANDYTIAYVDPGEEAAAEVVTVTGTDIVVTLRSVSGTLSTAAEVKTAWDASDAVAIATVANTGGDSGAGEVTAMAAANFAGGTDYVYSEAFDLSQMDTINGIQMTIDATTLNGLATLDATMQFSYDKVTWYAGTAFTQLETTEGSETKYVNGISAAVGPYVRFKYDVNTVVPVKAALSTALTGDNNDLDYTAVAGGTAGNNIKIKYTDPGVASATESVSVSTDDSTDITTIDFSLATSAAVKASYTTTMAGDNNDIVITAVTAGTAGNSIDFTLVNPAAASQPLTVTTTGTAIVVSLATASNSAITSTANQVIAAVNGDYLAQKLVLLSLSGEDTGATAVTALSKVDLADGAAGGVITSTGDTIKATLLASAAASALVTAADKAANDGSGLVIAMAATALTAGADNVVLTLSGIVK